jgi:hypothetical protein
MFKALNTLTFCSGINCRTVVFLRQELPDAAPDTGSQTSFSVL